MGLEKKKKQINLDVRNIFAGSNTEHRWGCLRVSCLSCTHHHIISSSFHCFFGSALQILLQFLFAAGGALGVYKESGGTNQL
jgi:hypothetical protein